MNFHYILRKALGRPTCRLGSNSKLAKEARIINISDSSDSIKIGSNSVISGVLLVFPHGGMIRIGSWCYVGEQTRIWSGTAITIGDRVMIAHGVNLFDNDTHPISASERHAHFRQIATEGHPKNFRLNDRPINIEDDAWIGANCTLLKGITVGQRAIVGAGSVVTKDVPADTIVAGNPAKIIRKLNHCPETE